MLHDDLIAYKKLAQLLKNANSGIFLLIVLIVVFYLIKPVHSSHCIIWTLVTSAILIIRLFSNSWSKINLDSQHNLKKLQLLYDVGTFCTSMCLGYVAFFLVDEIKDTIPYEFEDYRSAIYILLITIIPGSIVIQGVRLQTYLCFIGPLTVGLFAAGYFGKIFNDEQYNAYLTFIFLIPTAGAIMLARSYDNFFTKLCLNEIELEESNKKLEQLASVDSLTNLYNRRAYDDYLVAEWDRNKRNGTDISLMIIDIDHFKEYNDHYGHSEGDSCLSRLSNIIKASLKRPADKAFRYGGDEFIVILPETDCKGTLDVGERIRMLIEELNIPHKASKNSEFITVSIGIACINPNHHENAKVLFDHADNQLYKSKQAGKNAVSINQSPNTIQ